MNLLCRDRGIVFLHVLQPALFDVGSKPRSPKEEEIWKGPRGWELGAEMGYPILRERGAELVELGVPFVDGSRMFADVHGDIYVDACHLNKAGNDILMQFVLDAFVERLSRE